MRNQRKTNGAHHGTCGRQSDGRPQAIQSAMANPMRRW
jgi:hypothetical protein